MFALDNDALGRRGVNRLPLYFIAIVLYLAVWGTPRSIGADAACITQDAGGACTQCDATSAGPNCTTPCVCDNGQCSTGISGTGFCRTCNAGWRGKTCSTEFPTVMSWGAVSALMASLVIATVIWIIVVVKYIAYTEAKERAASEPVATGTETIAVVIDENLPPVAMDARFGRDVAPPFFIHKEVETPPPQQEPEAIDTHSVAPSHSRMSSRPSTPKRAQLPTGGTFSRTASVAALSRQNSMTPANSRPQSRSVSPGASKTQSFTFGRPNESLSRKGSSVQIIHTPVHTPRGGSTTGSVVPSKVFRASPASSHTDGLEVLPPRNDSFSSLSRKNSLVRQPKGVCETPVIVVHCDSVASLEIGFFDFMFRSEIGKVCAVDPAEVILLEKEFGNELAIQFKVSSLRSRDHADGVTHRIYNALLDPGSPLVERLLLCGPLHVNPPPTQFRSIVHLCSLCEDIAYFHCFECAAMLCESCCVIEHGSPLRNHHGSRLTPLPALCYLCSKDPDDSNVVPVAVVHCTHCGPLCEECHQVEHAYKAKRKSVRLTKNGVKLQRMGSSLSSVSLMAHQTGSDTVLLGKQQNKLLHTVLPVDNGFLTPLIPLLEHPHTRVESPVTPVLGPANAITSPLPPVGSPQSCHYPHCEMCRKRGDRSRPADVACETCQKPLCRRCDENIHQGAKHSHPVRYFILPQWCQICSEVFATRIQATAVCTSCEPYTLLCAYCSEKEHKSKNKSDHKVRTLKHFDSKAKPKLTQVAAYRAGDIARRNDKIPSVSVNFGGYIGEVAEGGEVCIERLDVDKQGHLIYHVVGETHSPAIPFEKLFDKLDGSLPVERGHQILHKGATLTMMEAPQVRSLRPDDLEDVEKLEPIDVYLRSQCPDTMYSSVGAGVSGYGANDGGEFMGASNTRGRMLSDFPALNATFVNTPRSEAGNSISQSRSHNFSDAPRLMLPPLVTSVSRSASGSQSMQMQLPRSHSGSSDTSHSSNRIRTPPVADTGPLED